MRRKLALIVVACLWIGIALGKAQPVMLAQAADTKPPQAASSLEGEWNGTLDAKGTKLRLLLKVSSKEGKLAATIDSLDQNANGIPVSSVVQNGDQVKLELSGIAASFEGRMNAAGTEITGEWKQGGGSLPLVLKRAGTSANKTEEPKGPPATLAGFEDEASFSLILNEERLAVMQSSWKKDGSFDSHATVTLAGQTVEVKTKITPDSDGRWARIVIEAPVTTITLSRDGAKVTRTMKDKTTTWETRQGVLLIDNNSPGLSSQCIRAYDRKKGGAQKFPVLVLPGQAIEITLEAKEKIERSVAGKDLSLTRFFLGAPGSDAYIFADDTGKVYLMEVPAQKAAFVREGYESLRKAEVTDKLLSAPQYQVQVDHVSVPMRDGIKLSADVYRPQGVDRAPAILVRTPYKKEMLELQARFYARRGYVYVVQDCRGRFGSSGVWEPFVNEAKDGYDSIEWLAREPYTDGKVGMIGGSYLGWVQWWAAGAHLHTWSP